MMREVFEESGASHAAMDRSYTNSEQTSSAQPPTKLGYVDTPPTQGTKEFDDAVMRELELLHEKRQKEIEQEWIIEEALTREQEREQHFAHELGMNYQKLTLTEDQRAVQPSSLGTLAATPLTEPKYLWEPFLFTKGVGAIVGPPDSGKSTFARDLAITLAMGSPTFLSRSLTPNSHRVLYVMTEECLEDIGPAIMLQLDARCAGDERKRARAHKNLHFVERHQYDSTAHMLIMIDKYLAKHPTDLLIIDSFGDVFLGRDGNSNAEVRNTMKVFYKLSMDHNCAVILLSHLNKSSHHLTPDQSHVLGAGSFVQKGRFVFDIRPHSETGHVMFTITKGNLIAPELKKVGMKLKFDPTTRTFEDTGCRLMRDELGSPVPRKQGIDWKVIFEENQKLPTKEIIKKARKEYGFSERWIKQCMYEELEQIEKGVYRLSGVNECTNLEDCTSSLPINSECEDDLFDFYRDIPFPTDDDYEFANDIEEGDITIH